MGKRVLVVEDERDGQIVLSALLEVMEIECDVAATAERAMELLAENTYSAAVIDVALPGMDGIELLTKIRDHEYLNDLPCMIVTAYHSTVMKNVSIETGSDVYLAKPINHREFMAEIERMIESAAG